MPDSSKPKRAQSKAQLSNLKRGGPGRRPKPEGERHVQVDVYLRPDQVARLAELGGPRERSPLVRAALDAHLTSDPAPLLELARERLGELYEAKLRERPWGDRAEVEIVARYGEMRAQLDAVVEWARQRADLAGR